MTAWERWRRAWHAAVGLVLAAGCGGDGGAPASVDVDGVPAASMVAPPPPVAGAAGPWRPVPGVLAVDDALPAGEGWILLDGAASLLHLVDGEGRLVRTVGGRGDGPGELQGPRHLAGSAAGFQVVSADGRTDRFDAEGRFLDRAHVVVEGCALPDLREAVALEGRLYLSAICLLDRQRRFLVVEVSADGSTRTLVDRPAPGGGGLGIHAPVLATVGRRLAFGTGAGPCTSLLDAAGLPTAPDRCLSGPPLPLPARLRRELDATVGRRARAAGFRLVIPDHLPWYDRLMEGADGDLLARRPVGAVGWRIERLGSEGGRWPLPPGVELHAGGGRLLLVHHGADGVSLMEMDGARVPWEGGGRGAGSPGG